MLREEFGSTTKVTRQRISPRQGLAGTKSGILSQKRKSKYYYKDRRTASTANGWWWLGSANLEQWNTGRSRNG